MLYAGRHSYVMAARLGRASGARTHGFAPLPCTLARPVAARALIANPVAYAAALLASMVGQ